MPPLIESVPNFSEGRDQGKVNAILEAMKMDGVYLLDRHLDPDHNRSVATLAGEPGPLLEAVLRGVGKAAELIDLNRHRGVHPRIGATDVVPFVPLREASLDDCAQLARQAGAEIWKRYQIPVYLYQYAATRPERVNLENVRRGQFERLRREIATDPGRLPDFGQARLHPTAGATVVGARKFLVAYNIFLNTGDVEIARKVARTVRASGGGLPCVKAMGVLVRGLAQVSMNLTDVDQTPIPRVFEAVTREAARYGASPLCGEIVGLVPRQAVNENDEWFRQLENRGASIVLEERLLGVRG
jgi:glutamate formiminotransferase